MTFPETFLDRMKVAVLRKALDGFDLCAVGLHREHRARLYRLTVDHDCTGPAQGCFASHMCSSKCQDVSQIVHEQQARLDVALMSDTIHAQVDLHWRPLFIFC